MKALQAPEVATDLPGLMLWQLTGADCETYDELITLNRDHWRRHGDYRQEANATRDRVVAYFAEPSSRGQPDAPRG
ncbi:MAG TPA: hypothetical protein VKB62_03705 [Streptosporangiaceae bacterium]|nr:hypothetical protein [Streptosporangiaceae bacterium]